VLVIGGKPVPFSLARIPQGSEIRGNLAAGGKGVAQPLSARDREIATPSARARRARLLLVGLDVIGDCLTEINVTSPTCFQEITQQTGFDVPAMFIDALEAALIGIVTAALATSPSTNDRSSPAATRPVFVGGQRRGHHHRHLVVGLVLRAKSMRQVFIGQLGVGERVLALHVVEVGRAVRPQRLAVGQHEVERPCWRSAA
jgi:hypothetical protein